MTDQPIAPSDQDGVPAEADAVPHEADAVPHEADAVPHEADAVPHEESAPHDAAAAADAAVPQGNAAPQYGIGPFTIREVSLTGVWVIAFVVSFFSISPLQFVSVWTRGIDWILPIGVPTVAVFLIILRRLSPSGIRRVGSLGIDQFASVAFTVAAVLWLQNVWLQLSVVFSGGPWFGTWVSWAELVLMLAGVALTVFAPLIPVMCEDFDHRPDAVAHRSARPVRAVVARPHPVAPAGHVASATTVPEAPVQAAAQEPEGEPGPSNQDLADQMFAGRYQDGDPERMFGMPDDETAHGDSADRARHGEAPESAEPENERQDDAASGEAESEATEPDAARDGDAERSAASTRQAFWALVPQERDIVDESGAPIFRIGPTAWALVIEDRGDSFVVRDEDGRTGYLRDVSGVTRG